MIGAAMYDATRVRPQIKTATYRCGPENLASAEIKTANARNQKSMRLLRKIMTPPPSRSWPAYKMIQPARAVEQSKKQVFQ